MRTGTLGATRLGNTRLIDHGIQNEDSDIRAHVCVEAQHVYIFQTKLGKDAVAAGIYQKRTVKTGDIITAEGYLVPPSSLDASAYKIPDDIFDKADFEYSDYTSEKGKKAVAVVNEMIRIGYIPLNLQIESIDSKEMQIKGLDVSVKMDVKIQVKCDWRGGGEQLGGTGNLFLQTAECNPYRRY